MKISIADIIEILESIAPRRLSESWDNVGLQIGKRDWPVNTVWVALDPLPQVVHAACKNGIDLLITHHPLIFEPIHSLDFDTVLGGTLQMAAEHKMAVLSAHTNLDAAADGLNDLLADKIQLCNVKTLGEAKESEIRRLVLYLPAALEGAVGEALLSNRNILRFFRSTGTVGAQVPDPRSDPARAPGADGIQLRLEAHLFAGAVSGVLETVKQIPGTEKATYRISSMFSCKTGQGLGRIGELRRGTDLSTFVQRVKKRLRLQSVRVVGDLGSVVSKVAVCTGSGSGLLSRFFSSDAQVYVTGDLRYHDARAAEAAGRALIDVGHFSSEHLMKEMLAMQLQNRLREKGAGVRVEICGLEKDPFLII